MKSVTLAAAAGVLAIGLTPAIAAKKRIRIYPRAVVCDHVGYCYDRTTGALIQVPPLSAPPGPWWARPTPGFDSSTSMTNT